jgi:hypothetical protein
MSVLAFNSQYVCTGSRDGELKVWDIEKGLGPSQNNLGKLYDIHICCNRNSLDLAVILKQFFSSDKHFLMASIGFHSEPHDAAESLKNISESANFILLLTNGVFDDPQVTLVHFSSFLSHSIGNSRSSQTSNQHHSSPS